MEDIKVGEYVRTESGYIGKVEQINKEPTDENITYVITDVYSCFLEEVVKHSFNIIDLIEVGDYVNGHKVYESDDGLVIFNIDDFEYFVNPMGLDLDKYRVVLEWQDENYIKNVLTKEQFDREKYVVGE